MAPAEPRPDLHVEVVYGARPGQTDLMTLTLPAGATVADALRASGLPARHGLGPDDLRVGVWSRLRDADTPLRDRDRVEIYRPLIADPKEVRKQRAAEGKVMKKGAGDADGTEA